MSEKVAANGQVVRSRYCRRRNYIFDLLNDETVDYFNSFISPSTKLMIMNFRLTIT